jgi:cephalosporin hydroxylase
MSVPQVFHRLYYDSRVWQGRTTWLGVPVAKTPMDLWIFQEIIHRTRPELIIECGTFAGGSALYMAAICDLIGSGSVLTIDIAPVLMPRHPRVSYLVGSSVDPQTYRLVEATTARAKRVMVVLDSEHTKDHVLAELNLYSRLVTPGQYLVCEDSNVNGHPVFAEHGPGPAEALDEFLRDHGQEFEVDRGCEKFLLTFNPGGYLRRR